MMCSFEGASVARLCETFLKILCEVAEGGRVGDLIPQSQPREEALDASHLGPESARSSTLSGDLIPWLCSQELPNRRVSTSEEVCELLGPAASFRAEGPWKCARKYLTRYLRGRTVAACIGWSAAILSSLRL